MREESTTPDPEEAVRRSIDALNRGDFDAALSMWASDAVWELAPLGFGVIEGGPLIGREAIRKLWEDMDRAFEDFETENEEFQDLGRGVTFGVVVLRGRPHGSGGSVESRRAGIVSTWRDGRIARATNYTDLDRARAAAERLARGAGLDGPGELTTPDSEETLRRGLEALSRGDFDAQIALYSQRAVWDRSAMGLEVLHGREAILGVLKDWRASYEDYQVVVEEFRDLGNGVTFAVILTRGRPRGSGGLVEWRSALVGAVAANGLIERLASYADIDEARAAAERLAQEWE